MYVLYCIVLYCIVLDERSLRNVKTWPWCSGSLHRKEKRGHGNIFKELCDVTLFVEVNL